MNALRNSQQALENEKAELKAEKDNLTKANTDLTTENQKNRKRQVRAKIRSIQKIRKTL
ncbi:hypothetical protein DUHN55_04100 [Helicobacter pylori]